MLKNFKIDTHRDKLVPKFACFQMDLRGPMEAAIKAGEVPEDFRANGWALFGASPIKAKGFWVRVLESMFLGKGNHPEVNVDLQTMTVAFQPKQRVEMMFVSTKTNDALNMAADIAREVLTGWEIVALNGDVVIGGRKVKNRNAQQLTLEVIARGRPTLIIANAMAQRSFSIPHISSLYLAFDKGSTGTTIQKMSRALTPNGNVDKVSNIFSLSFDPNRDDKFDSMIVETANNIARRSPGVDIRQAMAMVLGTIDFLACTPNGSVRMDVDDYLEKALARKGISRALGKQANLEALTPEAITALANGNGDYFRATPVDAIKLAKGKTSGPTGTIKKQTSAAAKELAKARETVVQIIENMDVIMFGIEADNLADAIASLSDAKNTTWLDEEFGVNAETIQALFAVGAINEKWMTLIHNS